MKIFYAALLAFVVTAIAPLTHAEDGVLEFWDCDLMEGKSLDDAKAVNAKWLKMQNDANPGAGIRSWGLSSIVGEPGDFGYMDAFPTLEAWAKSRAASETPAGMAIDAELNGIATCTMNRLYRATEH